MYMSVLFALHNVKFILHLIYLLDLHRILVPVTIQTEGENREHLVRFVIRQRKSDFLRRRTDDEHFHQKSDDKAQDHQPENQVFFLIFVIIEKTAPSS